MCRGSVGRGPPRRGGAGGPQGAGEHEEFLGKNKLFVGEWVDDQPKTGVYTEVDDPEEASDKKKPHF